MKKDTYIVNTYLSLRLEDNKTNIYVEGELFQQCKFLLLDIAVDHVSSFDNIESVDEAEVKLDLSLEKGNDYSLMTYEDEFWGHCSNLQVWYENSYNTKLLHRNLAFPLLKRLTEAGDTLAKRVFTEEIAKRLESGYPSVVKYLIEEDYLKCLTTDQQISSILDDNDAEIIQELRMSLYHNFQFFWTYETDDCSSNLGVENKRITQIAIVDNEVVLPETIGKLTKLKIIWLINCNLEKLPDSIGNLTSLELLVLRNNNLVNIPDSIGNLKSLERLELQGNKIEQLPESIGNLKDLKVLWLNHNKLKSLPNSLKNLKHLEKVGLYGNNLLKIPEFLKEKDFSTFRV
ncbi:MAG: leucine-rich repeat domain-containing protein [Candidatus Thorarchaeota archaeon]